MSHYNQAFYKCSQIALTNCCFILRDLVLSPCVLICSREEQVQLQLKPQEAGLLEHKIPPKAKHSEDTGPMIIFRLSKISKWLYLVSYLRVQVPHYCNGDEPQHLKKCPVTLEQYLHKAHRRQGLEKAWGKK